MALTSLANVKEFLRITDTNDDTFLTNLISRVEKEVKEYCQRDFEAADYMEYYDGDGTDTLLVDNYPINSVSELYDDPDREFGTDTLIDSSDYIIYSEEGKIVLDGSTFSKGNKNIKIVYNAGYTTIPADLEQAVIKLVAAEYLEGQGSVNAVEGEGQQTRPQRLREQAYRILDRYRRIK